MRRLMFCALAIAASCAIGERPRVLVGGDADDVDALCHRHPLAADANIRADEIARTPAATVHLVQVRGGETPHRHATHDLTVTVLAGEGVLTVGDAARAMRAGDVAVVPRGATHWFVRSGSSPAVALVVFAPPLDAPDSIAVGVDSPPSAR